MAAISERREGIRHRVGVPSTAMVQNSMLSSHPFATPAVTVANREFLVERGVDIDLSEAVFNNLANLYGYPHTFSDFLHWAANFLTANEGRGMRFLGLKSNQTELLPAASFLAGGGLNIQVQTGSRITSNSPGPMVQFDNIHIVSTANSNMTEDQLAVFRKEIERCAPASEFLKQFKAFKLHFVIRSGGSLWDDRLCYNFEFASALGKLTTYTKAERIELCRQSGAILDKPGEISGLENALAGDLCGALLGLWINQNSVPIHRDGNIEANALIKQFIRGLDDPSLSHCLEPVSWWHVSRCLAHVNAGTRCAYGLALGKSIAFVRGGSYAVVKPIPGERKEYIWYWKGAVSFAFEVLINMVAVVVVCIMGLKSGLEIEWLAIMVSLVAHLSSWVRLAMARAEALKLRSWRDAKGRVKRSTVLKKIVSGELMANSSNGCWTLCEEGFDTADLEPTMKELVQAGAEVCGLTETCSTVFYKHMAGIVSKESEMENICYMRRTNVALKTVANSKLAEKVILCDRPD